MHVETLSLINLRNHADSRLRFAAGVNVLYGANGQGKTSVLEALALCALSRSFVQCPDAALLRRGADEMSVAAEAISDLNAPWRVQIHYRPGRRKKISSSTGKNQSPRDIIGEMPLVVLSPDFRGVTNGPPAERRALLDTVLAQSSKRYAAEAISLKHILKQRNALLHQGKAQGRLDRMLLEPWTDALIATGAEIVVRRAKFVARFGDYARRAYSKIAGGAEDVEVRYRPHSVPSETFDGDGRLELTDVMAAYREALRRRAEEEARRGVTLVGPQKDEVDLFVAGGSAREGASQGQHKSLLIGIKLAEFDFLRDVRGETPLLLLDDVFSELDRQRAARVLDAVRSDAQTFITTTEAGLFDAHFAGAGPHALFAVRGGKVEQEK